MRFHGRRHLKPIPAEGAIICLYILMAVVLLVCLYMRFADNRKGCYYDCSRKITATLATTNISFETGSEWKPDIKPGTSVYIIQADDNNADIIFEGEDPEHTAYARNVPLSKLSYDQSRLKDVQENHNCSARVYSYDDDSAGNMILELIIILICAIYVIQIVRAVMRRAKYSHSSP